MEPNFIVPQAGRSGRGRGDRSASAETGGKLKLPLPSDKAPSNRSHHFDRHCTRLILPYCSLFARPILSLSLCFGRLYCLAFVVHCLIQS